MPIGERSSVFQVSQLGVEVTPGTAVAALKQMQSFSLIPSPAGTRKLFQPKGYKWATVAIQGKEWSDTSLDGELTYNEVVYPLAFCLTAPVITPPAAAPSRATGPTARPAPPATTR